MDDDLRIRIAAFDWLGKQVGIYGDDLPRDTLQKGFIVDGKRIPLISPQGIFKPREMEYPLTITTSPDSPYNDAFDESGLLHYKYRGTNPNHRDNIGLREALRKKLPLIYFHGITPGKYMAIWPIYIVGDDTINLVFQVVVDDYSAIQQTPDYSYSVAESDTGRRSYITTTVRVRMHQHSFRERVLDAYQSQCSLCRLRHRELLDGAHIIPDDHPMGEPVISNGISLCKLHHAAFDNLFIGISPEYTIQVKKEILDEVDGPMLNHGLKKIHNMKIILPRKERHWPNKESLDWRYQRFLGKI